MDLEERKNILDVFVQIFLQNWKLVLLRIVIDQILCADL